MNLRVAKFRAGFEGERGYIAKIAAKLAVGYSLRNLDNDVVEHRLERRRRLLRDVVRNFVQRVSDGEFRRDFCDRKTSGLRSQRGTARDARIHLDDDQVAVLRVDGKLNVGTAGFDADLPDHRDRGIAHALVLAIGQRLSRRDGNESPVCTPIGSKFSIEQMMTTLSCRSRMTSSSNSFHPITDSSIRTVCTGTEVQPALNDLFEFFAVECDAAASAAERK